MVFLLKVFPQDLYNPSSNSWHSTASNGSGSLNVTIPSNGYYRISLRLPPSSLSPFLAVKGTVNLTVNGSTYNNCVVSNSVYAPVSSGYPTPANFFTCKIKSSGDTWLMLENSSNEIRAFNDDYGIASDGYSWGNASRITTSQSNITQGHVFSASSYNPFFECDLYLGLASVNPNSDLISLGWFPKLNTGNSFMSGYWNYADTSYNCYGWSLGQKWYLMPGLSSTDSWDVFYAQFFYVVTDVTDENAAIALWGKIGSTDTTFTHASVRKHSWKPLPHGFEWESKCGDYERIMHTRDALEGNIYGEIVRYYKPWFRTINSSFPVSHETVESFFSISDLNLINKLIDLLPDNVLSEFDERYYRWKNTWSRPEIAIHSNPYEYAESLDYVYLLEYCMKYGKAILPLVISKLTPEDIFVVNLLKDLTYNGDRYFLDQLASPFFKSGKPLPSLYSILIDYCKTLLAKESVKIVKSIRDIYEKVERTFGLDISNYSDKEVILKFELIKNEKVHIKLFNVFGGIEYESTSNLSKGNQTVMINCSNIKKGIYILQITVGGESISKTVSI